MIYKFYMYSQFNKSGLMNYAPIIKTDLNENPLYNSEILVEFDSFKPLATMSQVNVKF